MNGRNVRKLVAILAIAVVAAGGVLWGLFRSWEKSLVAVDASLREQSLPAPDKHAPGSAQASKTAAGGEMPGQPAADGEVQAKELPLVADDEDAVVAGVLAPIQQDLDSGDSKVVAAAAKKIMNHKNAKVRLKAVEALAWAEAEGFPELNKMLLDPDPEVARAALEAWALQVQAMESSDAKVALIKEVGETAMNSGADAFQEVLDAMMDVPDSAALSLLQGYAAQTKEPEILEKIYEAVNFRAQPENDVTTPEELQKAIEAFARQIGRAHV